MAQALTAFAESQKVQCPAAWEEPSLQRCPDVEKYTDHGSRGAMAQGRAPNAASKTVFYLAYGSNLAARVFQGRRNIHPLSTVNVVVPKLRLTFDLPGIPYTEPCFANSAPRPRHHCPGEEPFSAVDKSREANKSPPRYHKDRWHKGMVGVAYELTRSDYAHVLATEGGGVAYQDVVVDCYPLRAGTHMVPNVPDTQSFKAHTLLAPTRSSPEHGGRLVRPDPGYAQPSARYLKLLEDGAIENGLPLEYREYLTQIRPYQITSQRQHMGQMLYKVIWGPILMALFGLFNMFDDEHGRAPAWLVRLASAIFATVWVSYDKVFKKMFGDGERTENDEPGLAERLVMVK